jgi:adenosylhomocysteine nucleosidase
MIHLVVALQAEAKSLLRHFNLKPISSEAPFRIFEREGMRLCISGVGKIKSAAATAYLAGLQRNVKNKAWLNVGIGGHASCGVGEGFLANKITDQATGRNWYPPLVMKLPCQTKSVRTVDHMEERYEEDSIYDMEASGFFGAATQFSTAELVHGFKVVSDNAVSSPKKISGSIAESLIERHLGVIDQLIEEMVTLSDTLERTTSIPVIYEQILERWHFTFSEQVKLRRLLKRLQTLKPEEEITIESFQECTRAKDILIKLEHEINSTPVEVI